MTPAADSPTILIVDDTPANLGVIVESLEDCGFRVVVAQDFMTSLTEHKVTAFKAGGGD
jgi:CheY-like chemotaxis protein